MSFNKVIPILVLTLLLLASRVQASTLLAKSDRSIWIDKLTQIADPVLISLSKAQLKKSINKEQGKFNPEYGDRSEFVSLEAFARLMAGMAPWLELGPGESSEGRVREKYIKLFHQGLRNGVDPHSADYMNFEQGNQPLVDAAYLAQAFIRAPEQLWYTLPEIDKKRVIAAFDKARKIVDTPYSNWLLFGATLEAFYLKFGYQSNIARIEFAVRKHMDWYVGDGLYSDGEDYHWDYYNAFVIQPMLLDVVNVLNIAEHSLGLLYPVVLQRAQRYSAILERQISPEGTYPIIGRSAIYRFGAFQTLAQMALFKSLPEELSQGQVRAAMTTVMLRLHESSANFDDNGWLKIGLVGHQPKLAEPYITTGSLYMTSLGFLPLGLPANDSFWTDARKPWTMQKIWSGDQTVLRDKALKQAPIEATKICCRYGR